MKHLVITAFIVGTFFSSKAQSERSFKPFKFDISAGCALPVDAASETSGFLISFEPKYAINDQVSLGLKIETAVSASCLINFKCRIPKMKNGVL